MSTKECRSAAKLDDITSLNNKLNASKQSFSSISNSDDWKAVGRRFSCTSARFEMICTMNYFIIEYFSLILISNKNNEIIVLTNLQ